MFIVRLKIREEGMSKFNSCIFFILTLAFSFSLCYSFSQDSLDIALEKLSNQINRNILEKNKSKIAIIPFPNLDNVVSNLGTYLAEELTTNLFMTGKYKIIERSLLKQVLDELKLTQTGIVDPNSAKELGKMVGVDAIVTGTLADLGIYIAVNCRLIETETGEVFAAAKAKIKKDKNIAKMMSETIKTEERLQEERKGIREGIYNVKPNEKEMGWELHRLYFGIVKVEITEKYIIAKFYVKHRSLTGNSSTFQLKEAYIIDEMLKKYYLVKTEGLEFEIGRNYFKRIQDESRIWGALYFSGFNLTSPEFLLYVNGYEIEVNFILPN